MRFKSSAGLSFRVLRYEVKEEFFVSDLMWFYVFLGLMGVNIAISVLYFTGFRHLRSTFRRRSR